MVNTDSIPIRTVDAIDAELYDLALALQGAGAAIEDVSSRIDSDQFDGGRFTAKSARDAAARNARHNGSAVLEAREMRRAAIHERVEIRRRMADLRAERRLWTDRTPLGTQEIAGLLGYSADAPRQWKRRNVLPAPAGTVSGTPYWWRGDILGWALEHGRTRAIVDLEIPESEWDSDDAGAAS